MVRIRYQCVPQAELYKLYRKKDKPRERERNNTGAVACYILVCSLGCTYRHRDVQRLQNRSGAVTIT